MKKRKKPESGTWYAQREKATGKWWDGWWMLAPHDRPETSAPLVNGGGAFTSAHLVPKRVRYAGFIAIPVRCRALTAEKRNKKRTR